MIRRRPRAIAAIIEHAEYIGSDSLNAAERFVEATQETFAMLEKMPEMRRVYRTSNSLLAKMRVSVKDFRNFLVFYRAFPEGIEIITALHGATEMDSILEVE
jgi:toxin ParE1/3/4